MTTSGSTSLEFNVAEIIEEAYERGQGKDVQTLNAHHMRTARRSLNLIFAEWQNRNIRIWSIDEQTQTTTVGMESFTLPAGTVDVLDVVLRRDGVDTPMGAISRTDYHSISDKDVQGLPDRYWVHRPAGADPTMYIWQAADSATDVIRYWRIVRQDDITASTETADVPYRWVEALVSGLAVKLYMKLPLAERFPKDFQMLKASADDAFYLASTEDRDRAPTAIVPATWGMEPW